jgi:hypothetical protein
LLCFVLQWQSCKNGEEAGVLFGAEGGSGERTFTREVKREESGVQKCITNVQFAQEA